MSEQPADEVINPAEEMDRIGRKLSVLPEGAGGLIIELEEMKIEFSFQKIVENGIEEIFLRFREMTDPILMITTMFFTNDQDKQVNEKPEQSVQISTLSIMAEGIFPNRMVTYRELDSQTEHITSHYRLVISKDISYLQTKDGKFPFENETMLKVFKLVERLVDKAIAKFY